MPVTPTMRSLAGESTSRFPSVRPTSSCINKLKKSPTQGNIIVGGLTFFPALALGPIVEQLADLG